ncbi:MAG: peroxiredoxin family protein [Terriglobales bacterium]
MFGFRRYNYDRFRKDEFMKAAARHLFGRGSEPGDEAPDFEARTLDGDEVNLSDFRGEKNVVLTFGSSTCPFTAASIQGMNDVYEDFSNEDVEFFFVYVREAHPGEKRPAHRNWDDKKEAAEQFRADEDVDMPIIVDEVNGNIHKEYGTLPNPTYIIDKEGRVAFRALWTRPRVVADALEQLLEQQEENGDEHVVVMGGEDTKPPMRRALLHTHRALDRGGRLAVEQFREEMGLPGRAMETASRVVEPVAMNAGKTMLAAALAGGVIVGGLYAGRALRRKRLNSRMPYRSYEPPRRQRGDEGDYAVGI